MAGIPKAIYSTLVALLGTCLLQAVAIRIHEASQQTPEETRRPHAAILVSGTSERLSITPLLENVVRPSALNGMAIDVFLCLHAPEEADKEYAADRNESAWLKAEDASSYRMHPKLVQALGGGNRSDTNQLFATLCDWAKEAGAQHCWAAEESNETVDLPDDKEHRNLITFYNPISTLTGQALLKRWRTLERLWAQARNTEEVSGFRYNQILVIRDDDYWMGPYMLREKEFAEEPKMVRTLSCLEAHGLNDKVVHMGRQAAEVLLPLYQAWLHASDHKELEYARNAEEFMYTLATANGLILKPEPMPMAVSVTTISGMPCFRKQKFNLTTRGGYRQCYGEDNENGPLTQLFRSFNCDDLSPVFYKQLAVHEVIGLHEAMQEAASLQRFSIILTMTNSSKVNATKAMVRSLHETKPRENHGVVIVGTTDGVCEHFNTSYYTKNHISCVEVTSEVEEGVSKQTEHAIVVTAALSGLSRGILFVQPEVTFQKPPLNTVKEMFEGNRSGYDFLFMPQDEGQDDAENGYESPYYVRETPGSARALLQAWMKYVVTEEATLAVTNSSNSTLRQIGTRWSLKEAVSHLEEELRVGFMDPDILGVPVVGAESGSMDDIPPPPVEEEEARKAVPAGEASTNEAGAADGTRVASETAQQPVYGGAEAVPAIPSANAEPGVAEIAPSTTMLRPTEEQATYPQATYPQEQRTFPQATYPQATYPQATAPQEQPTYPQPTFPQPTYPQATYPQAASPPAAPPQEERGSLHDDEEDEEALPANRVFR